MHAPRVQGIWRYPVKSMQGESVRSAVCESQGIAGDRVWAAVADGGAVVSAKSPDHGGALLDVTSRCTADGTTHIFFGGGPPVVAGSVEADEGLSDLLGYGVRLSRTATAGMRLHRLWPAVEGLVPDWQRDSRAGEVEMTPVGGAARGSFADFGPMHVVTSAQVRRLEHEVSERFDVARLRPNLLLDVDQDLEPGQELTIGNGVLLRVTLPTPRCIVPSLPQGDLPAHPTLLSVLAKRNRRDVPGLGRAACFGWYADVLEAGVIAVDDLAAVTR